MATLQSLRDRLRLELGDNPQGFQAKVVADGATTRYNLPVEYIALTNLKVYLATNPVTLLVLDTDYSIDARGGVLNLTTPPAAGTVVVVEGSFYETFLDSDLDTFINTAFAQHTHNRLDAYNGPFELADLPGVEDYLVVILAQVEALWALITDAAQEIDVRSPDGVAIPVGQRYEQLMGLLAAKKAQYEELCQTLNVGMHRIEMFTLRRVSRTTNRLVPVYRPQEYDEIGKATRVYPPIDRIASDVDPTPPST